MNLYVQDLNLSIANSLNSHLISFLTTLFSVITTAFIGWTVYKWQQRERKISSEISHFGLLLSSIIHNLELNVSLLERTNAIIKEIDDFINNLSTAKYYADCFHGKQQLNLCILLPNQEVRSEYIRNQLKNVTKELILKETFISIYGLLDTKSYEKEAIFLLNYGNLNFHPTYKKLENENIRINQIINIINEFIANHHKNNNQHEVLVPIFDLRKTDYENKIEKTKQELLYVKTFYTSLKDSVECSIFYSDIALLHLIEFNKRYTKKYRKTISNLSIIFPQISIAQTIYDVKNLDYFKQAQDKYKIYSKIPDYELLNLTLLEKYFDYISKIKNKRK